MLHRTFHCCRHSSRIWTMLLAGFSPEWKFYGLKPVKTTSCLFFFSDTYCILNYTTMQSGLREFCRQICRPRRDYWYIYRVLDFLKYICDWYGTHFLTDGYKVVISQMSYGVNWPVRSFMHYCRLWRSWTLKGNKISYPDNLQSGIKQRRWSSHSKQHESNT